MKKHDQTSPYFSFIFKNWLNNSYLFFKNYSIFHFIFKNCFKRITTLEIFKNDFLFFNKELVGLLFCFAWYQSFNQNNNGYPTSHIPTSSLNHSMIIKLWWKQSPVVEVSNSNHNPKHKPRRYSSRSDQFGNAKWK